MSARAKQFLDKWIEGIAATGRQGGTGISIEAVREAEEEGILKAELLEEANGDLDSYIGAGLKASNAADEIYEDNEEGD